ncbi:GAF domain-containing protein [Natrinema salifodinae]|uniref:Signal transduction histidine kinase n=1 Tax=Natrinema salifodinae TaxID=1202768 RepID=A0A1I0QGW7_9EURY|nr:GAF domain-containing protein [Natrinema salifodinae]SEW26211.1 Signal transduction histidine kinase [Natrinema salifodinae]
MTNPTTSRPRTVLYVAATEAAASDGAAALERAESGSERAVQPISSVERVRNWAPETDCVVFAETPTTAAGATLLDVIAACGETPLVLFTDASYAPTAARSTDGIDGYVRRDTDDAVSHLADEIEWVCHDRGVEDGPESEAATDGIGDDEPVAATGETAAPPDPAGRLLGSTPDLAACRDREELFDLVVASAADALDCEYCWLSTVHFGEFALRATGPATPDDIDPASREDPLDEVLRSGDPLRIDDLADDDRLSVSIDAAASLCCVPVGDVGVLQVATEVPDAFDERDCELLAEWGRAAAAVLERLDDAAGESAERERLRRELDRLRAERDRVADERDRFRRLFANGPEPAVRYEIDDDRPVIRDVNDAFTEVFDTDPEAIVGDPVDESPVPPGFEHRRATLIDSIRAGERRQVVSRRETVDGVREFLLTLVPLEATADRDRDGADASDGDRAGGDLAPAGLIVYSDVTEANRRERELAAATERLATIADRIEADVRTPLNVAREYLELAEETGDREHFAAVEDAQETVRERVERLLAIAGEEDVLVETEPVAVHDVARQAWLAVETGDARLVTRAAENRVVDADKTQLRELFEHLIQAVIEGEDGGGSGSEGEDGSEGNDSPAVTVGATDDGFYVVRRDPNVSAIETETGPGSEANPVPGRLAATNGTGSGLDTVERIAAAHGWSVGVAEDDGRIAFAFRGVDSVDGE